jgi:DNA-directed RNA polymerase subunit RPC12/RpoP
MKKNITLLWIEAGKLLAENPTASVYCPVCEKDYLRAKDIRSGDVVEREIRCPSCGAYNYLRMVRPLSSADINPSLTASSG